MHVGAVLSDLRLHIAAVLTTDSRVAQSGPNVYALVGWCVPSLVRVGLVAFLDCGEAAISNT